MNINLVQVCGRITKTPELKNTPTGFVVLNIGIATNRRWADKQTGEKREEVEFHSAVCFGKTAETIAKYFNKGDEIYILGRLKTSNWEDKSGGKRYKTEIIIEHFEFGQKVKGSNQEQGEAPVHAPAPAREQERKATPEQELGIDKKDEYFDAPMVEADYPAGDSEIRVDDIPF